MTTEIKGLRAAGRRIAARLDRPVVLIGLMGAGKSAIGRRLARALALPFVDADREIEEAAGCSISDIFAYYGEESFRDVERRVIARLLEGGTQVIATGGGAFMNAETRARIAEEARSVWLRADLEILVERTSRRSTRPLLKAPGGPRAVLTRLMEERYPIYATADMVVDSRDAPPEVTVAAVVQALDLFLSENASSAHPAEATAGDS